MTEERPTLRLLVTGSRDWDHQESLATVLAHYVEEASALGHNLQVVHGKAARGLDALAASWVHHKRLHGWPVSQDPHPANWGGPCVQECRSARAAWGRTSHRIPRDNGTDYCPYAGFRRNQAMVDTRPNLCVGFHRNGSSGTRDCLRRAATAGIPSLKIGWSDRDLVSLEWLRERAPRLAVD